MQDFGFYFGIGWEHIISKNALDHQLFIAAIAAIYLLKDWKQVLILVTAFTIGHSVTLALSVFDVIRFSSSWVEFLIPCTIIITAVSNLFQKKFTPKSIRINYFLALAFGLIHGMGFANSIRFMLASDQSVGWGLFGFLIFDGVLYFLFSLLVSESFIWILLTPFIIIELFLILGTLFFLSVPFVVFMKYHLLSFLEAWFADAEIPFFDAPVVEPENGFNKPEPGF